jgi:hypothetical protein
MFHIDDTMSSRLSAAPVACVENANAPLRFIHHLVAPLGIWALKPRTLAHAWPK